MSVPQKRRTSGWPARQLLSAASPPCLESRERRLLGGHFREGAVGNIFPRIYKSKQKPKTLCWPVQYSHVEACLQGRCEQEVRLSVHFSEREGRAWIGRRSFLPERYRLLMLEYDPNHAGYWGDDDYRHVVQATVNTITVKAWKASGLTKAQLRDVLVQQVRRLTPKRLPCERWTFHLELIPGSVTDNFHSMGGRDRPGQRGRGSALVDGANRARRRGHGRQAVGFHPARPARFGPTRREVPGARIPAHHLRPRLYCR